MPTKVLTFICPNIFSIYFFLIGFDPTVGPNNGVDTGFIVFISFFKNNPIFALKYKIVH